MFFVRKFKITNSSLYTILALTIIISNLSCNCSASIMSSTSRTPKFFRENCTCSSQLQCQCCAKLKNDLFYVNQTLCTDWAFSSSSWVIQANVRLNENVLYTNKFSALNIPPFCVPIWPAIALSGCIQIHSITQHDFNTLHGCGNVTINFITFNVVNFQMGCMHIGTGGIEFVQPDHDAITTNSTETPPEIELETNDFVITNATTESNMAPSDDRATNDTAKLLDFFKE